MHSTQLCGNSLWRRRQKQVDPLARRLCSVLWAFGLLPLLPSDASAEPLRRPVALAVWKESLWVTNRNSGTLSLVSLPDRRVVFESSIGGQPTDLAILDDSPRLVITDAEHNEIVLAEYRRGHLKTLGRTAVAASPVSLQRLTGRRVSIASLWAHQLSLWSVKSDASGLVCEAVLKLPFAPRVQCLTKDQRRLIVADAFGPHLAVVDLRSFQIESVFIIPGHNIGGLAVSHDGQQLLVTHQLLNEFLPTTRNHVFWGNVMSNLLRSLPLKRLTTPSGIEPTRVHGNLYPLGREGDAAGDPTQIGVTSHGDVMIALTGVSQVALRKHGNRHFQRLQTGRGPICVAIDSTGNRAYLANQFDDSITVLHLATNSVEATIPLGSGAPSLSPAELGEALFYDARLSLDGWFSCHSCHTDGHSSDLKSDNLGDDGFGAPKRIPSLLGTGVTGPWTWHGKQLNLTDQIRKSLYQTMHGGEGQRLREEHVLAISSYLQNLAPAPPKSAAREMREEAAIRRGQQLFDTHDCARCHQPPSYTTPDTFDVGTGNDQGPSKFNPPSLLGVSQRFRFLHDGRAQRLRDVFVDHRHPHAADWTAGDVDDLVAFLETL